MAIGRRGCFDLCFFFCRSDDSGRLDFLRPFALRRCPFRRLDHHQAGYEFLYAVEIEVDGGTVGIRFSDYTKTVLEVLDIRTFFESFQGASLGKLRWYRKNGRARQWQTRPC